jgi:hypothetical protein
VRTVVYDPQDMEPLTVIDVQPHLMRAMEKVGGSRYIRFPIPTKVQNRFVSSGADIEPVDWQIADIRFEPCKPPNGSPEIWWVALAINPEVCLLLRSVFLTGQQKDVQDAMQRAFQDGANKGMVALFNILRGFE